MAPKKLPTFDELPLDKNGPPGNAWGLWGSDDQLGRLNLLTPETVRAAASEIREGIRISLDWPLDKLSHPPFGRQALEHRILNKAPMTMNDDVITLNTQSSTQWDGFRHYGYQRTGQFYMGHKQEEFVPGSQHLGIDAYANNGGIIGRGVLIDWYSWSQRNNISLSPFQTNAVEMSHIRAIIAEENIEFCQGDILFIRVGFTAHYNALSPEAQENFPNRQPGGLLGLEATKDSLRWLWDSGFSAIASDAAGFERGPATGAYNHPDKNVKTPDLLQRVTATGEDFLVGDFNLHHLTWSGDNVTTIEPQAFELVNGLHEAGMELLTPRGFRTYARGKHLTGEYSSNIDLTYASPSLIPFVRKWQSPDVPGFDSDHRVIMATLNLEVNRVPSTYYIWKRADPDKFRACVGGSLKPIGFPVLTTPAMVDNYARKVVQAFGPAIETLVPLAAPPGSKRPKSRPSLVTQRAQNLLRLSDEKERHAGVYTQSQQHYKVKRFAQNVIRKERSASFHLMLSQDIAKRRRVYFWARRGASWNKKALMPIRQLKANNVTHLPLDRPPPDDFDKVPFVVSQDLEKSEVKSLITGAPSGKAAGPDLLAYEGMKMAHEELLPYLHHLFAACLKLGHHPAAFKQACTVMLRKGGKDDYEQPKSWRPVALLPCMGKLLEKIFTHRLKQLAVEHNLLADVQFGTPGKCTTKALQYLLNNVYYAWTDKIRRLATIMGLDITGAYDRVDRVKLMRILQETGLQEWMLSFIWSFLTDRITDMRLPGFTSSSFWVNKGIPQGSPLSPILFLFFSMPIFGAASEYTNSRVKIYPFAYVDDTYLLAVSDDFEDNCKALKECHDRIMVWADSVGVSFSPHKYHVMHFYPPRGQVKPCTLMPKIPGLEGNKPEASIRILGVEVDNKLNWQAHALGLGAKVNAKMNDIARICNTTAGPDMIALRQLYITTVRPIISHGCGAWFIYGEDKVKYQITKDLGRYLGSIQNQCLRIVTGALARTKGRAVNKEAYVEDILVYLDRVATVQRARALDTPDHERLRRIRRQGRTPAEFDLHPYHALDHAARYLLERANKSCRDRSPNNVRKAMVKIAKQDSHEMSCKIWSRHVEERNNELSRFRSAADMDKAGWGPHNLKRYRGLSRAQSTMLIQCRTGYIALNKYLHWINAYESPLCDCGAADETVFHAFIQCEMLATARIELYTALGHRDFYRMLSEKPEIAADWAITHFEIPQFECAKHDSRFNSVESSASASASQPPNVLDELRAWIYGRAT
ncbi:hypothetical protein FGLOB1_13100 [Fusarium globosum]|uniref:Reverse transcriptase domain-containing protein n=1 Tax=Fusarium globosum TaxID=78864 RepID=A0A8H5XP96_9HYPO|nr:hypothetical protein FGLOB1_13100 [Fusarium globosum]